MPTQSCESSTTSTLVANPSVEPQSLPLHPFGFRQRLSRSGLGLRVCEAPYRSVVRKTSVSTQGNSPSWANQELFTLCLRSKDFSSHLNKQELRRFNLTYEVSIVSSSPMQQSTQQKNSLTMSQANFGSINSPKKFPQ